MSAYGFEIGIRVALPIAPTTGNKIGRLGLLRQYWAKSTDFKTVTIPEVDSVIVQLNDRPRKTLEYDTPAKLMAEHLAADAPRRLCTSELNLRFQKIF
jgi:hypothetical protein